MQILKRFPDTIAANMAKVDLAQHGIDSFVADDMISSTHPAVITATGGVRLMVPDEDVNSAAAILQISEAAEWEFADMPVAAGPEISESEVSGPSEMRTFFGLDSALLVPLFLMVVFPVFLILVFLLRYFLNS